MKKKDAKKHDDKVPVFAAWPDVAPSLIFLANSEQDARAWIDGYNTRGNGEDIACTLGDIVAYPKEHGVGCQPGGL